MVPEEIRKIERPKNTIVQVTKKEDVYLVVQRIGCRYDNGRRLPVNGKVIGHIIDGRYVPKEESNTKLSQRNFHVLKYGCAAFADKMGAELYRQLKEVFHPDDARDIYCLALIRTSFPETKDYQARDRYEKSWISHLYPRARLSKNDVCDLLLNIGKSYDLVVGFMRKRVEELIKEGTRVLIDGMLKSNTSNVNSFSGFSYKGRIKGTKDISIIAAVDAEKKEPICMKVYKGSMPDTSNFTDFIQEFSIKGGIEIGDKAFTFEKMQQYKDGKVGFLHPLKRSSKKSDELGLASLMVPLRTEDQVIMAAKKEEAGLYYYLFRDEKRAAKEEADFIRKKDQSSFDSADYKKRRDQFGTICFVSNCDFLAKDVYDYYTLRWEIETVFRMYKGILSLNTTRVHDDCSVIGTEFVNYLSSIITCKMKSVVKEQGLFKDYTLRDIIGRLSDMIMVTTDPKAGKWDICNLSKSDLKLKEALGV